MRRLKGRKPSPALIVAIAALCAGLVGTAVAGPITADSSKLSRAELKTVIKLARTLALRFDARFTPPISNREITKRAPGLSVAEADKADSADTANSAKTADSAKTANSANTANTADNAAAVGGIKVVPIRTIVPDDGGTRTVLNVGGFQIRMTCSTLSQVTALTADTTATDGFLLSHSVSAGGEVVQNGVTNDNFDSADNTNLSPDVAQPDELEFVTYFDDGTGPNGSQVRARYAVGHDDGSVDGATGCYVVGTAEVL